MKYVSKIFFKKILSEVNVLGNKLWFLAFSASQLRSGSCWFLYEENKRTAEVLISELGDFSKIFPASKRAARIGQMFSASWDVKSIDMNSVNVMDIEEIASK